MLWMKCWVPFQSLSSFAEELVQRLEQLRTQFGAVCLLLCARASHSSVTDEDETVQLAVCR